MQRSDLIKKDLERAPHRALEIKGTQYLIIGK